MAFRSQHFLSFRAHLNKSRCLYFCSSISLFPFSTIDTQLNTLDAEPLVNQLKDQVNLKERYVLDELSNLLPRDPSTAIPHPYKHQQLNKLGEIRVVTDRFLLPEEKLRGVFLQKLKGKSAIESALSDTGVNLSLDVVVKVLNRGNLGAEAMVMFFNWAMKQPIIPKDIHSYNIIIKALGRRKFFDFMLKILKELSAEGIKVNLETLSIVMDSLFRARRVCKAIQVFGNSEEFGFECNAESLNVLLQCLCRRSHVGVANSYFNSVKGKISFNSTTYNIIIGGWSKFGRVIEMERIFEAMVQDGFAPDCSTCCCLIEGLGRAGRIKEAVKIFDNLREKDFVLDTGVYNAMIFNFISVGDLDECMKHYRCMLSDNCDPNVDTYAKLISAFIKARRVADALEMFDEMLGRRIVPPTTTITSFIEPLCSFGPPHAAMMISKKARKAGCKISLTAYKLLLMRLSRFGKCGMLLNIWDEMQESGYSSDVEVYEYVINGLCNIGQLENAVLVMEESLSKGFCPSRLICSKLNNKLLASSKVEKAYKLFLKIKDARRDENAQRFWRAKGWHF
ncbi:hypothetical protein P3X46_031534 [Hevea brasiliensis]|uniref:Pentacotripeptide-repeat region of PRORP domain-containing protein n=1 Tax=Hevea brasiliensis TaxID=3981 RepID=A0ABQ9KM51_HEVBR|nr:putative pentatricopeptide repeat-containing protein At5g43820 [Hevea brasiliensis]XP_057995329.1 putative pentatricopeptide repeat-containing protein At5g43820 [Hevea brasiliensis]KAJ9140945.1 hypothetical protein P3X46_031534 [Hevea brasiliensis]